MGKRGTFSFRVTESLREALTRVASARKRSVSEEIEARLARSFELDALLALMGGADSAPMFIRTLAGAMDVAYPAIRRRSFGEEETREALQAVSEVVNAVFFWRPGVELPEDTGSGSHRRLADLTPREIGVHAAYEYMFFSGHADAAFDEMKSVPLKRKWAPWPEEDELLFRPGNREPDPAAPSISDILDGR